MKKAFGLAILASLLALPAFAGETFVRNENFSSDSHTTTNLNLDSKTNSVREEKYASYANKIYKDGSVTTSCNCGTQTISYDDFTQNTAAAALLGTFKENTYTRVYGTINTIANEYTSGHETSAGVR
ncbi:hypothetical protein [Merismopedia glauca]|uniref:Filamentous hemagglutinin n=1 Tax=Merismopedia glauca CCAP 1448/3 TaxID=1296344 RepID=A0A2T1C0N5_9CYAN|nr:hypothetical protein [Merismopedia glauca]PSB01727.1 hypothetical protein C7B64_16730 [Merismopedia glauca CCAP 1448/3]